MNNDLTERQSDFMLYTSNDGQINVNVMLKDESVWPTQKAMAKLFWVKTPAISKHLSKTYLKAGNWPRRQLIPFWKQFRKNYLSDFDKEIIRIAGKKNGE